jgi:hypothetical protein
MPGITRLPRNPPANPPYQQHRNIISRQSHPTLVSSAAAGLHCCCSAFTGGKRNVLRGPLGRVAPQPPAPAAALRRSGEGRVPAAPSPGGPAAAPAAPLVSAHPPPGGPAPPAPRCPVAGMPLMPAAPVSGRTSEPGAGAAAATPPASLPPCCCLSGTRTVRTCGLCA